MDPITAALTAARFVVANWKWFLIGGLTVAVGFSRWQLDNCRKDFAAYKIAAVAAAAKKQKEYDGTTRAAEIIYVEGAPKIITQIRTVTKWITHNVENVPNCPGPDVIRVYNASITGERLPEAATP